MNFAQRCRERREELGLSRQQLSELLGVSLSAVSNYETVIIIVIFFDCF